MADKFYQDGRLWAAIPGQPDYFISLDGQVMSRKGSAAHIIQQHKSKRGHHYIHGWQHNRRRKIWVHRAVLMAFDGVPEPPKEARHLDGNTDNNHYLNLAWGTRQDNVDDMRRHGTIARGERSASAKLTAAQVLQIRREYGAKQAARLAAKYGVSKSQVYRIANGKRWAHLRGGMANVVG